MFIINGCTDFWLGKGKHNYNIKLYFNIVFFLLSIATQFKQQEFRVKPKDVNAREGSNVTLSCEINDVIGDVQWTKDGLALGRSISL